MLRTGHKLVRHKLSECQKSGLRTQDKSLTLQASNPSQPSEHDGRGINSLNDLLSEPHNSSKLVNSNTASPISPYRTFSNRIRHGHGGTSKLIQQKTDILESDQAIQNYYNSIRARRGNNGYLSHNTRLQIRGTIYNFANYADLPITNTAFTNLIRFKKQNPYSTDIEQVLQRYSVEQPLQHHSSQASWILGIFKANFTPLQLRVNTHFPPAEENCSEGTFLEIYQTQDQETKDMIQWQQYVPERASASYLVPFEDIDLTRKDYAIVWIQANRSKSRTKHPCFVPLQFAKRVIESAKASGRNCPFPNYQSLWKRVTIFAKEEYKVRLISHYMRKRYVDIADGTTIPKSQAAFIMGDKTKIIREGIHLDLIYGRGLRFIEELIKNYDASGLADALTIDRPAKQLRSKEEILAEIQALTEELRTQDPNHRNDSSEGYSLHRSEITPDSSLKSFTETKQEATHYSEHQNRRIVMPNTVLHQIIQRQTQ
ncbi:MAG: hypothetical protein ACYCQJ_05335 [Nitrososphaerales archaeon]